MKKSGILPALLFAAVSFAQQAPEVLKTTFPPEALKQRITSADAEKLPVGDIIKKHKGHVLVIDFWASWCKDCVLALPGTKELKEKYPGLTFVYFSLDRNEQQWKSGLEKYGLASEENYWFDEGWKNSFNNAIDLNWVPRFILVDQKGEIAKYYSISPDDPELRQTIETLLKKQ